MELIKHLIRIRTVSAAWLVSVQVSLVLEYCDWGSLRTALDAGAFFAGKLAQCESHRAQVVFPQLLDCLAVVLGACLFGKLCSKEG
jgi:hypothetical protein